MEKKKADGKIRDYNIQKSKQQSANGKIVTKLFQKKSPQKNFISETLLEFTQKRGLQLIEELKFALPRKFRFDWCIPNEGWKLAFEYEGLTDHGTIKGMMRDVEKYNMAQALGWRVIRLNFKNYKEVENEINKLL